MSSAAGDMKPKMLSSATFGRSDLEAPIPSGDDGSNGGFSDAEPESEPEPAPQQVPALKVPPLKLILKPPPQQPQQTAVAVADVDSTLRRGRRRRPSDFDSEPEVAVKPTRTRKRSEKSENVDFAERRSVRTRKQSQDSDNEVFSDKRVRKVSNNSDNEVFSERRTRKFSNNSENEFLVEARVRTRRQSNTEKDRNSNYDETETHFSDKKVNADASDDDGIATFRPSSRTRNYGSRNLKPSQDELDAIVVPARSARGRGLDKIVEEPDEKVAAVDFSLDVDDKRDVEPTPVEVKDEAPEKSPELPVLVMPLFKAEPQPDLKPEPRPDPKPAEQPRRTYGGLRNSRAKPEAAKEPEVAKPEVESSSADLNLVPDHELSSLTRARTVASDTNVAAEFKAELRTRLKTDESSTSQSIFSSSRASTSSSSSG